MKPEKHYEEIDDNIEATPKTTLNQKVVYAIKNLQALYNEDANKIVKQVANLLIN